jgi:hypothetical protein
LDLRQFKSALCAWIVCSHVSFSHVEHPKFQNFGRLPTSRLEDLLPIHNTAHNWIEAVFSKQQDLLIARMKASPFRINWGFDLWTSSNNEPILGIVAHWLKSGGQSGTLALSTSTNVVKRGTLLAIKEIRWAHKGANIEATFWEVVQTAGRETTLGYFMLDNASSNTTVLARLENRMDEMYSAPCSFEPFVASELQLHCIGHIFNFVARRILFGKGVNINIECEAMDEDKGP